MGGFKLTQEHPNEHIMKVFTNGAFRGMNLHMGINPKNPHIPVLLIIEIRNWKHFHTTVPT